MTNERIAEAILFISIIGLSASFGVLCLGFANGAVSTGEFMLGVSIIASFYGLWALHILNNT